MVQYLLIDTDILIDVGRGIEVAFNRLQSETKNTTLAITTITQMELIVGCRNKVEFQHLQRFLRYYTIIKVNESICDKALELLSKYRLSHGLLIPDSFIAATAIVIDVPLLSKNQKDYRFISELNLLPYPSRICRKSTAGINISFTRRGITAPSIMLTKKISKFVKSFTQ